MKVRVKTAVSREATSETFNVTQCDLSDRCCPVCQCTLLSTGVAKVAFVTKVVASSSVVTVDGGSKEVKVEVKVVVWAGQCGR